MDKIKSKKFLIPFAIAIYLIIMGVILLPPAALSFPTFLTIVLTFPMLFISDVCFVLFPIAIIITFLLSIYTLISKNYTKFNNLYAALYMIIVLGIINLNVDNLCNNKTFVLHSFGHRITWYIFLGFASIISLVLISKKKDTRIYLYTYAAALLMYLVYQVVNILD